MEPLRGAPLAEELDDVPLPVAEVCQLGTQLCDAVGALHHVGVVHCCLGPDTVWRTPEGAPLVTGFAFARDLE